MKTSTFDKITAGFIVLILVLLVGWYTTAGAQAPRLPPVPAKPIEFATEREANYWSWLVSCNEQLDIAQNDLAGERKKVRTATVTVNLSCPAIPACPACSVSNGNSLLEAGIGALGGALVTGALCAGLSHSPGVTVVK